MTQIQLTPYSYINGTHYIPAMNVTIKKSDFNGIQFQDGRITFSFINCLFTKIIIENEEDIDFPDISISFYGCHIESIQIQKIVSKNISVHFLSSIISGKINDCNINAVSFNNCILKESFFLINLSNINISFTEENIFPREWNHLLKRIGVNDLTEVLSLKQSFFIYDCLKVHVSSNAKEYKKTGFYLREHERNPKYKLGYRLTTGQKGLLNVNFSFKYDTQKNHSETRVIGMSVNSMSFSGYPDGKIFIENTTIGSWYIHEFNPKGEASFYNISPNLTFLPSKIAFHTSRLDNTWFDNTNFDDYSLVSFYRTKFSKTVFTSCKFPKNSISFERFTTLENIHYPDRKEENYYKDQYEVYLQLKMALEATGNFYEGQKLYAISNDALRKIEEVSASDKFILWLNRWSNNHGLSIKRPLIWFVSITIGVYIVYLLSLGRIFNRNEIDWSLIGYYFSFVDLTHRSDFLVDKSEFNIVSLLVDYINKVVVSFFIFQFVAAFRKYGRK